MQLLEAHVKHPARTYSTKYGERLNAVFSTPDGLEVTVWSSLNYQPLTALKRGDRVQLAKDHKGNHRLLENSPNGKISPIGESPKAGWSLGEKKALAAKIEQQAALLRFCLETAQREFGEIVEPSDIRALATTLFLSVNRP